MLKLPARVQALLAAGRPAPGITFVRVGEDPASQAYVRMKGAKAAELGIRSDTIVLAEATPQAELLALIHEAQRRSGRAWHPGAGAAAEADRRGRDFQRDRLPQKDVDGFHPVNVGKLLLGPESAFQAVHARRACTNC